MAKTKVHGEYLKDSVVRFTAKAGENITKGQAVYISGISGEVPVVSLADADDTAKMPAFGLAEATVSTNAEVEITSFGTLKGLDTSSFSLGDILYVDTTAGSLTNNPSGLEATKLQNIGIVQRVHATSGSIKVGGAGRTNAVPNLDDGDIFIGDSNNKAISSPLSTEIESYLDGGTSTPILTSLTVASDTDIAADIGRAKIGYIGFDDFAGFAHRDNATTTNYALLQYNTGETYLNAASGRDINFRINNSNVGMFDSSGNLLVGTTDVNLGFTDGDDGFAVNPAGYVQSARSSTNANLYLNKLDYNGDIIDFRKDGTTVGSISTFDGEASFGRNNTGIMPVGSGSFPRVIPTDHNSDVISDGAIDLGYNNARWKDLYLSGTANVGKADVITSIQPELHFSSTYSYVNNRDWRFITNNFGNGNWGGFSLERSTGAQGSPSVAMFGIDLSGNMGVGVGGASGGAQPQAKLDVGGTIRTSTGILFGSDTAAANTLDDYEEGTWTPSTNTGTISFSGAIYTKVGRIVTAHLVISNPSDTSTGNAVEISLPFAAESSNRGIVMGSLAQNINSSFGTITGGYLVSTTLFRFYNTSSAGYRYLKHSDLQSSSDIYVAVTYMAA